MFWHVVKEERERINKPQTYEGSAATRKKAINKLYNYEDCATEKIY